MAKRKRTKGQTAIYKTLHRKLKQCESHQKIGGQLWECSERVNRSCSTSGTRRVTLVTNPMISHERGTDREVFAPSGTYCHLWHRYIVTVYQVMLATITLLKWWLQLTQYEPLVQYLPCKQQPSIKEILIGTTSAGISNQLRDIYTI